MKFKHFILVSVLALLQSNCAVEEEPIISSYSANYKEINGDVDTEDSNEIIDNVSDIKDVIVSTKLPRESIYNKTVCGENNLNNSKYLSNVKDITTGNMHTCALLNSGHVACWGRTNTEINNYTQRAKCVEELENVVKIESNGGYNTCALMENETVKCAQWFDFNENSEITNINNAIDVSVGDSNQFCVLKKDKTAECFGNGFSEINLYLNKNFKNINQIKMASGSLCILTDKNLITCLNYNNGFNVINLNENDTKEVSYIDYKIGSNLCYLDNNDISCANYNFEKKYKIPIKKSTSISTSSKLTCSVTLDENIECFDMVFDMNNNLTNILVTDNYNIQNVKNISVGGGVEYSHACALIDNGTVKCWGDNYNGQLGIGTSDNNTKIPTLVETN